MRIMLSHLLIIFIKIDWRPFSLFPAEKHGSTFLSPDTFCNRLRPASETRYIRHFESEARQTAWCRLVRPHATCSSSIGAALLVGIHRHSPTHKIGQAEGRKRKTHTLTLFLSLNLTPKLSQYSIAASNLTWLNWLQLLRFLFHFFFLFWLGNCLLVGSLSWCWGRAAVASRAVGRAARRSSRCSLRTPRWSWPETIGLSRC